MVKKVNKKSISKKLIAISGIVLLASAGITGSLYINNQNSIIDNLNTKIIELESVNDNLVNYSNLIVGKHNDLIKIVEDLQNQEPIVINETKIVEVNNTIEIENPNYEFLIQEIYDNNGDISFALDRLDEDEMFEVVDRLILISNLKSVGFDEIESDLFDEVHRMTIDIENNETYTFDRRDLEKLDIEEDVEVLSTNFRFDDFVFKYTGTFRDEDNNRFEFDTEVVFKDGKFDKLRNINVSKI